LDPNPYAPPKSNVEGAAAVAPSEPVPTERLYSLNQIAVATFLGTPVAGAWLTARNQETLGRAQESSRTWTIGIATTLLLLVVSYLLPDRFPNSVLPLACALGFRALAEARFGPAISAHRNAGGRWFSWWQVVGIGLLCALILVAVVLVIAYVLIEAGVIGATVDRD
jgi:hypothetical protein